MAYRKPQLKRLERIDPEEYKILCYLRYQRRRAVGRPLRVEIVVQDGRVKCRELVEGNGK